MKKSVIAGVFIALSFTTCSAIANSLALSLANDDAGKFQPILNAERSPHNFPKA